MKLVVCILVLLLGGCAATKQDKTALDLEVAAVHKQCLDKYIHGYRTTYPVVDGRMIEPRYYCRILARKYRERAEKVLYK